jgi:hypothetical protein
MHCTCMTNSTMIVNPELSEKYKGKKYWMPDGSGRIMTVSHVLQSEGQGGPFYEVFYNIDKPIPGRTGHSTCSLTTLKSLVEIQDDSN